MKGPANLGLPLVFLLIMARYFSVFFIIVLVGLSSCEHSSKNRETHIASNLPLLYKQGLTHNDSIEVKALIESFMNAVQDGKYADAVANLYRLNTEDSYYEPELLDNQSLEETLDMMKKVKILSYSMKTTEFITPVNNPTKCEITAELSGTNSPIKLTWVLNPVNYMGKWLLCFATK